MTDIRWTVRKGMFDRDQTKGLADMGAIMLGFSIAENPKDAPGHYRVGLSIKKLHLYTDQNRVLPDWREVRFADLPELSGASQYNFFQTFLRDMNDWTEEQLIAEAQDIVETRYKQVTGQAKAGEFEWISDKVEL